MSQSYVATIHILIPGVTPADATDGIYSVLQEAQAMGHIYDWGYAESNDLVEYHGKAPDRTDYEEGDFLKEAVTA